MEFLEKDDYRENLFLAVAHMNSYIIEDVDDFIKFFSEIANHYKWELLLSSKIITRTIGGGSDVLCPITASAHSITGKIYGQREIEKAVQVLKMSPITGDRIRKAGNTPDCKELYPIREKLLICAGINFANNELKFI